MAKSKKENGADTLELVFKICGSREIFGVSSMAAWLPSVSSDGGRQVDSASIERKILLHLAIDDSTTAGLWHFGEEDCDVARPFTEFATNPSFNLNDLTGDNICVHTRQKSKQPFPKMNKILVENFHLPKAQKNEGTNQQIAEAKKADPQRVVEGTKRDDQPPKNSARAPKKRMGDNAAVEKNEDLDSELQEGRAGSIGKIDHAKADGRQKPKGKKATRPKQQPSRKARPQRSETSEDEYEEEIPLDSEVDGGKRARKPSASQPRKASKSKFTDSTPRTLGSVSGPKQHSLIDRVDSQRKQQQGVQQSGLAKSDGSMRKRPGKDDTADEDKALRPKGGLHARPRRDAERAKKAEEAQEVLRLRRGRPAGEDAEAEHEAGGDGDGDASSDDGTERSQEPESHCDEIEGGDLEVGRKRKASASLPGGGAEDYDSEEIVVAQPQGPAEDGGRGTKKRKTEE